MNYIYPVKDYLTITQEYKGVSKHAGIDFGWRSAYTEQPIVAVEDGTVVTAVDGYGNTPNTKIYGNYVILSHSDGNYTVYGHLKKNSICVKKGAKVKKGQQIGNMGNTGYSFGQHLHFELRKGGNTKSRAIDPIDILATEGDLPVISSSTLLPSKIKHRTVIRPVERNEKVEQVKVTSSVLNMRAEHSTTSDKLGYCPMGYYDVLDKFDDGRYVWCRIGDGVWIANAGATIIPPVIHKYNIFFRELAMEEMNRIITFAKSENIPFEAEEV